jgi:uncharacterized protein YecE (DUF72 family)
MQVYVGTSGWFYSWNEGGNLEWFVRNSRLNSVELNASFYRFPFKNQVLGWAKKGEGLKWSIKVHRLITHQRKFNEEAVAVWERFQELFAPLDPIVSFYLFQVSSSFTEIDRILSFAERTGLDGKFALELRNKAILEDPDFPQKLQGKVVLVSIDSPDFQEKIFPGRVIYLRMHGRTGWYTHNYTKEELSSIAAKIRAANPEKAFIFFNNDHNMLENARAMLEILSRS